MGEVHEYTGMDKNLVLDIPIIDKQHSNLVRIAKNLQFTCQKNQEAANHRFISAVHEAVEFVRYHFSTEEKLMKLMEYPDLAAHKREHADFIWEILSRSKQFQAGQSAIPTQFAHFLNEWVQYHIGVTDRLFADYFLNMEHHGKLRLSLAGKKEFSPQSA